MASTQVPAQARAPKRDVTTRMLLLQTRFGYDFFNESYLSLATEHGQRV